jgi:hypothetical protein
MTISGVTEQKIDTLPMERVDGGRSVFQSESKFVEHFTNSRLLEVKLCLRKIEDGEISFEKIPTKTLTSEEFIFMAFKAEWLKNGLIYDLVDRIKNGKLSFNKIPMKIFAADTFVSKVLESKKLTDKLIAHINSWDSDKMLNFIDSYDVLPEAMLGKLFAIGVNPDLIPYDVKLGETSERFLAVACNENPKRLLDCVVKKTQIHDVRIALNNLKLSKIINLAENGLPLSRVPTRELSNVVSALTKNKLTQMRVASELSLPINKNRLDLKLLSDRSNR